MPLSIKFSPLRQRRLERVNCLVNLGSSENITVEEVKNGKWKRVTLYCLAISFSVANMLLASQFGLHP